MAVRSWVWLRVAPVTLALSLGLVTPSAAVDMTGRWEMTSSLVPLLPFVFDVVQTGTLLSLHGVSPPGGVAYGTITPATGAFAFPYLSPPCPSPPLTGTVAADGLTFAGSQLLSVPDLEVPGACISIFQTVAGTRLGPVVCGNGSPDPGEGCDDGNAVGGDGCDPNCTPTGCGNGAVTAGEECDDGNLTNGDGCDSDCSRSRCGNGIMGGTEECDDGNTTGGDGCDSTCRLEACGNLRVDVGEACDDGNLVGGDGCEPDCTLTPGFTCGNGAVDDGEQCDDGNHLDGDGCGFPLCVLPPTALCNGGTAIVQPRASIGGLNGVVGDDRLTLKAQLRFPAGTPAGYLPLDAGTRGAQLLIEDLFTGLPVLDLTGAAAIPPGPIGTGCNPSRDGWKANATNTSYTYTNRSGGLPALGCTIGSASGLRHVALKDRRASTGEIALRVVVMNGDLENVVGQLRITFVLGGPSASADGACGRIAFNACQRSGSGRTFTCE